MNILDLLLQDGIQLKRVASTHGGEYAGPCPFCGGKDRFRVWPEEGRYWCRQCNRTGDAIQYLREAKGLSFSQACKVLDIDAGPKQVIPRHSQPKEYRETKTPNKAWQEKALTFLLWAQKGLWNNTELIAWLKKERGLAENTIRQAGLGWNSKDTKYKLDGEMVWLPKGLVIPYQVDGMPVRLRIRRPNPENGPRYYLVPGSDTRAMVIQGGDNAIVVVESELDAILLSQEAGDIVTVIALGNAQARPDKDAWELLKQSKQILVSLDSDKSGVIRSLEWWEKQYSNAKWWPVIEGKDPTEAMKAGVNLRTWVMAGLDEIPVKRPAPGETSQIQQPLDYATICRKLIKEIGDKVLTVYSHVLDDTVIFTTKEHLEEAKKQGHVVYTSEELAVLLMAPPRPETLRKLHMIKQVLGGEIISKQGGYKMQKKSLEQVKKL